ncbi:MAG: hypothetical protein GX130_09815 [Candidatus Hydrogenedens sp.]|nr:hypothetical protein [Candidatus Hydrogenedens sp.]
MDLKKLRRVSLLSSKIILLALFIFLWVGHMIFSDGPMMDANSRTEFLAHYSFYVMLIGLLWLLSSFIFGLLSVLQAVDILLEEKKRVSSSSSEKMGGDNAVSLDSQKIKTGFRRSKIALILSFPVSVLTAVCGSLCFFVFFLSNPYRAPFNFEAQIEILFFESLAFVLITVSLCFGVLAMLNALETLIKKQESTVTASMQGCVEAESGVEK